MSHPKVSAHIRTISVALAMLVAPGLALAQAAAPPNVAGVRISGNKQLSDDAVLTHVKIRVGQIYDEQLVAADVDRLLASGRFMSVRASAAETDEGMIVTFQVSEWPLVQGLSFEGNKSISDVELASQLAFRAGDPMNRFHVETGRQAILSRYRDAGHHAAEVIIDTKALDQRNEVIYIIVEGPRVYLRKVRFEGNESFRRFRLAAKVGSSAGIWLFNLPIAPGRLNRELIQRDIHSLRNFYVTEGFLEAGVDRTLELSADGTRAILTFVIEEGPRYRVSKVLFEGNEVFTDSELARRIGLVAGKFYTAADLRRDVKSLRDTYGQLGHIDASVDTTLRYRTEPGLVDVLFSITEGSQFRVGKIIVRGNTKTQDRVIRGQMRLFPGQLYNTVAVDESRLRLVETGLFNRVEINPVRQANNIRNVLIQVEEGLTSRFAIGAGISTRDGLIGSITYTETNFDILGWPRSWGELFSGRVFKGAGQRFSLVAKPGTELAEFYIDWFEPRLLDQPYSLGLRSSLFTRVRENYDETRFGGVASVGHRFANRWYGEVSGRIEGIEITDIDPGAPPEVFQDEGEHMIVGAKGMLVRDRTDSRWLPSTGDRFRFSYEQVLGDFNFGRIRADYRVYRTVRVDALGRKHIITTRVSVGQILGSAPVFEKFYSGGIGSVRGFAYRGISPRSVLTDDAIGGDSLFFAGVQYGFPIFGTPREGHVRGVVFLDTGTVATDFAVTTYRAAIGVGIRWTVPIFGSVPFSLDLAIPLSKEDNDDTQPLSFSLGWAF